MNAPCAFPKPAVLRATILVLATLSAAPLFAAGISGTVRAASGNSVLQGMTVAAYDATGLVAASATTDANGMYALSPLPGPYRLLAYDPNGVYATAFANGADSFDTTTPLAAGTNAVTLDFQLQTGGSIAGAVRDAGVTLSGITVAAYNIGSGTRRGWSQTGSDGAYSLVLPAGSYKLVAFDDSGTLGPLFYPNDLAFAEATPVNVTAGQTLIAVDFALQSAALVGGTAVDSTTGTVLPSINVYAYTAAGDQVRATTTDGSGHFLLSLAAGSYRFVAGDPTATYASAFLGEVSTFAKSTALTLAAGQSSPDVTIRMERAGQIRGHTADSRSTALAGIHVAAYNEDGTPRADTTSDASGAFSLPLPTGAFRFDAYDDNLVYATQFYQQRFDFASALPVNSTPGQITTGIDFSLSHAGHFTGTVTDATSGMALAGITVAAYDENLTQISSAVSTNSGQYNLVVPAGTFRLVAWDAAHVYANSFDGGVSNFELTAPRSITADSSQPVSFAMRRGVILGGRVVTAAQAPVSGIQVQALDVDGHHVASAISADDGSFSITVLPASYKLFVRDPQQCFFASFYDRAITLSSAAIVLVPPSGSPAPVTIVVTGAARRRTVAH